MYRTMQAIAALLAGVVMSLPATAFAAPPDTVYFPGADGTELVGYLFRPSDETGQRRPAVVMLHGRGGPYSSNVNATCSRVGREIDSPCNARTLSLRHRMWGEYWAAHGYFALHVDSFGPRGRAHGYGRNSHDLPERQAVNEMSVRPLDAEAALAYLTGRDDVQKDGIVLQGWSNGGSTALNVMYRQAGGNSSFAMGRFGAALVFYPGCGVRSILSQRYRSDTDVLVFLATNDEEVSPRSCLRALQTDGAAGKVEVIDYPGATHDFDDPGRARQSVPANRAAKEDAMRRAALLLEAFSNSATRPAAQDHDK
jgi:carboxymethylenebutenolidase